MVCCSTFLFSSGCPVNRLLPRCNTTCVLRLCCTWQLQIVASEDGRLDGRRGGRTSGLQRVNHEGMGTSTGSYAREKRGSTTKASKASPPQASFRTTIATSASRTTTIALSTQLGGPPIPPTDACARVTPGGRAGSAGGAGEAGGPEAEEAEAEGCEGDVAAGEVGGERSGGAAEGAYEGRGGR